MRAKRAYELLCTSGFPSIMEAIYLVEDGNFYQMSAITRDDIRRAYDTYGVPPAYVCDRETKRQVSQMILDESIMLEEKKQVLYSVVMYIDCNKFLITACKLLQLTMCCRVEKECQMEQLNLLCSRGFISVVVHTDPQSAFKALTQLHFQAQS
jgi:hypothetical protein